MYSVDIFGNGGKEKEQKVIPSAWFEQATFRSRSLSNYSLTLFQLS